MYEATISFSGIISMTKGEKRELSNPEVIQDLLDAGYIKECKTEKKAEGLKAKIKNSKH